MIKKLQILSTLIKFLFSFVLIIDVSIRTDHLKRYLLVGLLTLLWITAISQLLLRKNKHAGRIFSNIFTPILNAQYMVYRLGGTWTSMDMLTSLHTLGALKGGNTSLYILGTILVLVFSFLPIYDLHFKKRIGRVIAVSSIVGNLALSAVLGTAYSSFVNIGILAQQAFNQHRINTQIEAMAQDLNDDGLTFADPVNNGYKYPDLNNMPNVVLIFTEGFSQSIVDDPRGLMPNVKYYENNESIFFTNYYNHTSATYRGIPCQLHSGFQFEDMDDNNLMSLQKMFDTYNYDTTLVNPEPYQTDFASHLSRMGFDHFVDGLDNSNDPVSDKRMYGEALKLLDENTGNKPKLITMYTFGTHVGQDSPDEKWGDGSSNVLNRFHNVDTQFGNFMDQLKKSDHAKDTLVILTTDHASYVDDDYKRAFPNNNRVHNFIDQIPMLFWYDGVKPIKIDCQSRTSIDMAPTVLDYLNMKQPSDFLGTSLFAPKPTDKLQWLKETTYIQPKADGYWTVANGDIHPLAQEDEKYMQQVLTEYCARATAKPPKEK